MDTMVERRFGRFAIQPARRQVLIDGEPAKIGSRAFDVLMALVERRERVVSKAELLDLVWPGIAVEENNLQVHIMALRKLLGSDAIATIPGRGYQFTLPVEDQPAAPDLKAPRPAVAPVERRGEPNRRRVFFGKFQRLGFIFAAALIAIVAASGAWRFLESRSSAPVARDAPGPAQAAHLSIVILPFANLSNDPAQDYFADGITENLTTDLSRIPGSFVIARNTAFTFKGKTIDATEIGKELGVRYVLEGSAQRDGSRVRVNAQLVDAASGAHLWADRFEDDVADLFALQDAIVARLGNALGFELVKAEAQKSARSKSPDAIDLTMRGWSTMWGSIPQSVDKKRESYDAAQALFERALEIDAAEADALAGDAFATMAKYAYGWSGETDLDAKVIAKADQALALAPNNVRAYHAKSGYLTMTGRADEALRAADSGLAVNPNYAPLVAARALAETPLGRFDEAKSDVELAIRLSPRDPEIGMWRLFLGNAELGLRRFDAASVQYQMAIDAGFRSFQPFVSLAAADALGGKPEDAKSALTEGLRLQPNLTVKWLVEHAPNIPPLFEGLRKAGLPEG